MVGGSFTPVYDGNGNPTTYGVANPIFYIEDKLVGNAYFTSGYRPDDLRGWKQSGSNRTYFVYDGAMLIAECSSSGDVTSLFGYGAGGLALRKSVNLSFYYAYTFDPSGNLVQRHNSNGSPTSQTTPIADFTAGYDGFGSQRYQMATKSANPGQGLNQYPTPDMVGFAGQYGCYTDNETDAVLGTNLNPHVRNPLVLMGHRYYDPKTARFLTRDPIGYEGGINLYTYAGNNPITKADPSGLIVTLLSPEQAQAFYKAIGYTLENHATTYPILTTTAAASLSATSATVASSGALATGATVAGAGVAIAGASYLAYNYVGVPLANSLYGPQTFASTGATSGFQARWLKARAKAVAEKVTSKYGIFKCLECSNALVATLKQSNFSGEILTLSTKYDRFPGITSRTTGGLIAETGWHIGVKIGDTVFDPIHKKGISYK